MALFRRDRSPADVGVADPSVENTVDVVGPVPDDLPRNSVFTEPLILGPLEVSEVEDLEDDHVRVTFRLTVKDSEGRRCPDLAVEATVTGPERTAKGETTTDLMGRVRFRMTGPRGTYAIEVHHAAAGALAVDAAASTYTLSHEA